MAPYLIPAGSGEGSQRYWGHGTYESIVYPSFCGLHSLHWQKAEWYSRRQKATYTPTIDEADRFLALPFGMSRLNRDFSQIRMSAQESIEIFQYYHLGIANINIKPHFSGFSVAFGLQIPRCDWLADLPAFIGRCGQSFKSGHIYKSKLTTSYPLPLLTLFLDFILAASLG